MVLDFGHWQERYVKAVYKTQGKEESLSETLKGAIASNIDDIYGNKREVQF